MKKNKLFIVAMAATAVIACTDKKNMDNHAGIKPENLDTTAVAGNDFYQYACGGWMATHPLTPEYARYGSFDKLAEDNREQLKGLIDEITAAKNTPGTNAQKIADLYNLYMDTVRRDNEGIEPIKPVLARIAAINDRSQLFKEMVNLSFEGVDGYFGMYVGADMMNSKNNIVQIGQGGLTLGQKEYYLDTDEATTAIREKYKQHIVRMFTLCGYDEAEAQKKMESILGIETRIAQVSYSNVQMRDPAANYHKMSYDELCKQFPGINWNYLFTTLGMDGVEEVDVNQPEPIHEVEAILAEVPVEDQKAYMEWQCITGSAGQLSTSIDKANFDFFGTVMSGRQEQQPMWKRATGLVSGLMGEAIGQLYVEKYFPAAAKERMVKLVGNLQQALGQRIDDQEWMSADTKKRAHEKLDAFYVKVGYPDTWKDYSGLNIDPQKNLYANMVEAGKFMWNDMLKRKFKKPVDPTEWHMTPQTVNAYYNPTTNEICFPAGILQYPFFDMDADDAFNYGAIGVVIGHEMTHGFDDQGRQFDKDGNFADWWAEGDADKFKERVQVLVDHFNNIEVLPGLFGNGALTLGENIADHGGLMVAYQAFKNATKDQPQEVKYGFTPEQRFFLAYAAVWAGQIRDEEIRNRTKSDPHSLGRWRVNGTLPHIDAWYDAFHITSENALYIAPENRAKIW
ncbi:MAG: M13 family metallopeptidase [Bacteroidaceae bacterium]|nr:M13 family metallopeptidase [Bacteroidaceae bacterium]MBR4778414.1 M13 family metallopeptidase [Bacteroidaceae bacterium]